MTVAGPARLSAFADQAGSEVKDPREQQSEQNLDPAGSTEDVSQISSLCHRCLASYQDLTENIRDTEVEYAIERGFNRDEKLMDSQDAKARFRAWAVNIAALQKIHLRSSLDFRLKDAAELRQRIVKILEELVKSLENASSIVSGNVENRTWKLGYISDSEDSEDSEGDEQYPQTSELDQRFSALNATNTNLMKLSMIIRNSPSRDDYLKAASRYNFDSRYDIGHVKEKHGPAKGSKDWLLERLGKGITRRRQFLKYREEHHGKLARDWDTVEEEKAPDRTVALTKATTFVDISSVTPQSQPRPDSDGGGSLGTQTSYEQTVAGENAVNKLSVPPPPNMAFEGIPFEYGKHFQCPYCFTEQIVKNKAAWKKHVFRDLRPYVCTFKECNLKMFSSRNEWFMHELQNHRRHWICIICATYFNYRTVFSDHLETKHQVSTSDPQFGALTLQSEEAVDTIPADACPLCDEWEETLVDPKQDARRAFLNDGQDVKPYGTLKQFRRHMGRHMEQLALFALPMAENEDLEDDSASGHNEDSVNSASVQVYDDDDDGGGETSALHGDGIGKTMFAEEQNSNVSSVIPQPPPRPDSDGGGSFGSQTSYDQTVAGESLVNKLYDPVREYVKSLTEDFRNAGMDEEEIELAFLRPENHADGPGYTRLARRHISPKNLKHHGIKYEIDADPDYLLIKRWVFEYDQTVVLDHIYDLRRRRVQNTGQATMSAASSSQPAEEPRADYDRSQNAPNEDEDVLLEKDLLPALTGERSSGKPMPVPVQDRSLSFGNRLLKPSRDLFPDDKERRRNTDLYDKAPAEHLLPPDLDDIETRYNSGVDVAGDGLNLADLDEDDEDEHEARLQEEESPKPALRFGQVAHTQREKQMQQAQKKHEALKFQTMGNATASGSVYDEVDEEGNIIDPDEPRYCLCNRVSFGTMIGCENGDCEKEWFHLECVGLKEAPPRTTKWYCPDCRLIMKPGLATPDQESGETEAEAFPKGLHSVAERMREGAEMSQATLLAAERNTHAMEEASLEAQQARIAATQIKKGMDDMDAGEF